MYAVKELFVTLQGEGAQAGRAAVFVRFTGCNLWSGRAADRGRGAGGCAAWCDTDFVGTDGPGGGKLRGRRAGGPGGRGLGPAAGPALRGVHRRRAAACSSTRRSSRRWPPAR
jgi:hypothetical protein